MNTRLLLICPLLAAAAATADEIPLRLERAIEVLQGEQEDLVAVPLDRAVFAATADEFADLRVHDTAGDEVPYLLRRPADTGSDTRHRYWTPPNPTLRPLEEGGLEITVTLEKDAPAPDGLCLDTPLKNFEQRVRIESSPDGTNWQPLGQPAVLFDYTRYMDVRNTCIDLPETPHRHFRILIDDVTAEQQADLLELTRRLRGDEESERTERVMIDRRPFRIDQVRFRDEVRTTRIEGLQQREYPIAGFEVTENDDQQTVIEIRTHREPLTSFTVATSDRNFSRRAVVQIAGGTATGRAAKDPGWQEIASTTISRIDFKSLRQEQRKIDIPETRAEQYRIIIDNRDSPPLDIVDIEAAGHVYEAIFLAQPGEAYRLVYDGDDVSPPEYDVAALRTMLREGYEPAPAKIGPESTRRIEPTPVRWSELLDDRRLLVTVITILVVILGFGLYQASRRIESDDTPSEAS
ncbi:MAG: DUF3999 family protein [Maioricimonas sp. JB049]